MQISPVEPGQSLPDTATMIVLRTWLEAGHLAQIPTPYHLSSGEIVHRPIEELVAMWLNQAKADSGSGRAARARIDRLYRRLLADQDGD